MEIQEILRIQDMLGEVQLGGWSDLTVKQGRADRERLRVFDAATFK